MKYQISRLVLLLAFFVAAARGQITESPQTVAPGRFLFEMDALSLTIKKDEAGKYTGFGAGNTFITTGLTADWDLQLGAELFISQKYKQGSNSERNSGVGDVYVRTKWRMYNDAESGSALAVIPYVKIPTNSGGVGNKSTEGGLIVPWTAKIFGVIDLAAMGEFDLLRNDADNGYDSAVFFSAALSRQVTKAVGLYAEGAVGKSSGGAPWAGTLGGGVTFAVSENVWWDFAVYRGVTRGAADWNPVLRFNWGF